MKILVLSDSHSSMRFMRLCVEKVKPNAVIHLGDYYDDSETLEEEYPHLMFHRVPGNCDKYRCSPFAPRILNYDVGGVRFYMTHGHNHNVKMTTALLLSDARKGNAKAVLYGHTHIADCHQEADGLWVLNPGSCGHSAGSAGVIETADGQIVKCYLIQQTDLEDLP